MLDIAFIRHNTDLVRAAITNKRVDLDLDALLAADKERREVLAKLEQRRARKNEIASLIPKASKEDRPRLIEEGKAVKLEVEQLEPAVAQVQKTFDGLMLRVPSIPRPEVPIGVGEEDNVEIRKVGTPREFAFKPKDHVELMTLHKMVNWDGPRKFAGGRSYALTGTGALLELAVTRLAVDTLVERGLTIVVPPVMVKERAMVGTGFFPLGTEEAYAITADELYLVGTSEVPLVSLHCDDTLDPAQLPIRYAGISNCFRREAGAYGKDTKGLYRVHQFTKVEQVIFCVPDEEVAEKEHYQLLGNAEAILAKLEIPYRVAIACTGEIGLGQTRKHEVESWMPGRNDGKGAYNETHSCSTLGDFQARRSNIRLRMPDGSLGYPYTLNNTAIASPRILIPLLENHQNADGSITLPKALVPYMNGVEVLRPKV
ncbi:Seryl-tRNA synthetase [Labilithrix luteola]|uniref:Serine--tRNA ligase n=1 Tax=Labilithrix luteola TaxID=1391654 RepID=A0A0K1Q5I7_9BACT|nr:serine--tRNA ligase [Labilithrix luteola]AKV00917.1 Seryl-tRNA synthetase [Labilithrix luteola]